MEINNWSRRMLSLISITEQVFSQSPPLMFFFLLHASSVLFPCFCDHLLNSRLCYVLLVEKQGQPRCPKRSSRTPKDGAESHGREGNSRTRQHQGSA